MSVGGLFITGTDTDVGKTWVAVRLIQALKARGVKAIGFKPIECGSYDDSEALLEASGRDQFSREEINPIHFDEPLAPSAVSDPIEIDFDQIKRAYGQLQDRADFVVVEGAGGWLVPLDRDRTVADLASFLALPVAVVAANRLGCLNHTLLTVEAIKRTKLECRAVFLNQFGPEDLSQSTNAEQLTQKLAEIPVIDQSVESLADRCVEV